MAKITVLKFGGTSMGDEHTWKKVLDIVDRYERPWVVVSATARTTRRLIAAAEAAVARPDQARDIAEEVETRHRNLVAGFMESYAQGDTPSGREQEREDCGGRLDRLSGVLRGHLDAIHEAGNLDHRTRDAVASIGERLSSWLLASCARAACMNARWVDARRIIRTDDRFGSASPDLAYIRSAVSDLLECWPTGAIPVMGGYYGETAEGDITTLGFEGSDYTASLVGASLPCEAVEIWTDVSGVYTCDPRVVEGARPIPSLSFREATELAWFGAKVLHPSTLKPASGRNLPVHVKNIFEPDAPGTRIGAESGPDGLVKAMAYKDRSALLTVTSSSTLMGYNFLSTVFAALRERRLPVDVVTTTEASVSVALDDEPLLEKLAEDLQELGEVGLRRGLGVIGLVGCAPSRQQELLERMLHALGDLDLETLSYSRAKRTLNLVLEAEQTVEAVRRLHAGLFET